MLKYIIQKAIKKRIRNGKQLSTLKRKAAFKFKRNIPNNISLLKEYRKLLKKKTIKKSLLLENLLKNRPIRTLSGIAAVTVITKPYFCPGQCLYCPNEKNMPKSYLPDEPACLRAALAKFDPSKQVKMRLQSLEKTGHPVDKIELIILGGTWHAYPPQYQTWFIKKCFEACNNKNSLSLLEAQRKNEKAKHRIVGLTVETRPDCLNIKEIKRMRKLGCTRVELGVQSIYERVLKLNQRNHDLKTLIETTRLLKDAGFKINYHIMLNLPGSSIKKDKKMVQELFVNQNFQPDFLKIYPCFVLKNAPLYKLWLKNKYHPYSDKELINLLIAIKKIIPPYVRIVRIVRDIPAPNIVAGTKISNLREVVAQKMKEKNLKCQCIRCREPKTKTLSITKLKLFRQDYPASNGQEIFLSYEDKKRKNIYALLRLRIPSSYFSSVKHFIPVLKNAAIIREVHTYGQMARLNEKNKYQTTQHKGLGKKLIQEAEKIVKREFHLKKIAVISGVGVRNYYRKLGYRLKETYMVKFLT